MSDRMLDTMTSPNPSSTPSPQVSGDTDRVVAERVLRLAADGIGSLANQLDDVFFATLDLFQTARGRIVVSGMGKSGHIARKIAATLASTGTPRLVRTSGRGEPRRYGHDHDR